jgi:hypothetical protein
MSCNSPQAHPQKRRSKRTSEWHSKKVVHDACCHGVLRPHVSIIAPTPAPLLTCGATGKIALRSLDDPSRVIRTFANKAAASPALYSLAVHPTRSEFITGGAEHVRVRARSLVATPRPFWHGRVAGNEASVHHGCQAFPRCCGAAAFVSDSSGSDDMHGDDCMHDEHARVVVAQLRWESEKLGWS